MAADAPRGDVISVAAAEPADEDELDDFVSTEYTPVLCEDCAATVQPNQLGRVVRRAKWIDNRGVWRWCDEHAHAHRGHATFKLQPATNEVATAPEKKLYSCVTSPYLAACL